MSVRCHRARARAKAKWHFVNRGGKAVCGVKTNRLALTLNLVTCLRCRRLMG